jgi:dihydrofolate synthase/folylpolyglutamate synthase
MLLYAECDYVVLEAGLGGEHDATAVFQKSLTLVTPIDKDHEAFLGDTIESIATTKLNAVQNYAILAKQSHNKVYEVASILAKEKDKEFYTLDYFIQKSDKKMLEILQKELYLAPYLLENLSLAMAALHFLKIPFEKDLFHDAKLFGRLSYVQENVLVDVGHNTLAAKRILESLREDKYILVYNSYKDKNYKEILDILQPIIEDIYIIKVDEERIETRENMQLVLENLGFSYKNFTGLRSDKKYLVFGSFSVAESFLKGYIG